MKILTIILAFPLFLSSFALADADWNEWTFRTADKMNIFVVEMGKGSPVVFLHGGWGAEHSYLKAPFKWLAKNKRLIFYDMRGSLRSRVFNGTERPKYSLENHLLDLEQLRTELKVDRVTIVAHSMGTFLAMNYIQNFPSRVDKVILIAPVPASSDIDAVNAMGANTILRCHSADILRLLKENNIPEIKNCNLASIVYPSQRGIAHRITQAGINLHNSAKWRELEGLFYFQNDASSEGAISMPPKWDFVKPIKSLKGRVLVVQGDDDYIPLVKTAEWSKRANAKLVVVKDAGHIPWIDKSTEVTSAVASFLEK